MTPEGIVAVSFFGKFALLFTAYPVVMGMRVTSNEEDDGILDVLLSLPVARWQVILEKFAAHRRQTALAVITAVVPEYLWQHGYRRGCCWQGGMAFPAARCWPVTHWRLVSSQHIGIDLESSARLK